MAMRAPRGAESRSWVFGVFAALSLASVACSPGDTEGGAAVALGGPPPGTTVGAAGGAITLPSGLTLTVPQGATTGDVVVDVTDLGPVGAGALSKHEAALGHRFEVVLRAGDGRPAALFAPDEGHPILFTLPISSGAIGAGQSGYAYLALPGDRTLPLLLDPAGAGATEVAVRLYDAPPVFQVVAVASEPWSKVETQAAAPWPGASPQGAGHPAQDWDGVAWEVWQPNWYSGGDEADRAKTWLPEGAKALAALGLRRPRLGLTKSGRYLAVVRAGGGTEFLFEPGAGDADVTKALKDGFQQDDDIGQIAGFVALRKVGTKDVYDDDGQLVGGFPRSSCPHELVHAVAAAYGLRFVGVPDADRDAVKAGAGPLPLPYQPVMPGGHPYFAHRGFEEGIAALVGHAVVQGGALAADLFASDVRGTQLDWPLAIGNANNTQAPASTDADRAEIYGSMDFFAWLVRRYAGGKLDFLPALLELWAAHGSANYDVMSDLHGWLPGGPATLADAYVEYVVQRAFLRDDDTGGVIASRLRGASALQAGLADDSQHEARAGLWATAPSHVSLATKSLADIVPYSARPLILTGTAGKDVHVDVAVSGSAPATAVRVVAMQAKAGKAVVAPITASTTLSALGLDPSADVFLVVVNVDPSGKSASVDVTTGAVEPPGTCADGNKNGDETDQDCGGSCPPCAAGKACSVAADCSSGVCAAGVCKVPAPSCKDGKKNGDETDQDCGGSCPPCAAGKACSVAADCSSGVCAAGVCKVPAPSCKDGKKNGDETDQDCGGSCPPCGDGLDCTVGFDCLSGSCQANVCAAAAASCADGVKNGSETAKDCGGSCPACADGLACGVDGDCQSSVCTTLVCQAPTCADGVKNGSEAGVDCGGPCPACGGCNVDADCSNGNWCNVANHACAPKLPNGTAMPKDAAHASPTLNGKCTQLAAMLVCIAAVCDAADDKCGYANDDGPCTQADAGTVCRSGACSVVGTCMPLGGCNADADCSGGNWCNETVRVCVPKLANGAALPTDNAHANPILSGKCTQAAGALVCVSGICDAVDNKCGLAAGDGPCTAQNGGTVCRSGGCGVSGTCS